MRRVLWIGRRPSDGATRLEWAISSRGPGLGRWQVPVSTGILGAAHSIVV